MDIVFFIIAVVVVLIAPFALPRKSFTLVGHFALDTPPTPPGSHSLHQPRFPRKQQRQAVEQFVQPIRLLPQGVDFVVAPNGKTARLANNNSHRELLTWL